MMMKQVMTKAWEIAREGVKKFGGKVKEYFAEALRIAWAIVKKGMEKVQLVGSEKQIAWAESIREDVIEVYNIAKKEYIKHNEERMTKRNYTEEKRSKWYDRRNKEFALYENAIFNNSSAKFFINEFGHYSKKEKAQRERYLIDLSSTLGYALEEIAKKNDVVPPFAQRIYTVYEKAVKGY